jgi:hypothetical protein
MSTSTMAGAIHGLSLILGNGKKGSDLGPHDHMDNTDNFTRGWHTPPDIARRVAVWTNRRGSRLSARQQAAFASYMREGIFSISNVGKYPEKEFIEAYFNFFDDMCFGGNLKGYVTIKLLQLSVFYCHTCRVSDLACRTGDSSCGHRDCGKGDDTGKTPPSILFGSRSHRTPLTIRIWEPTNLSSSQDRHVWKLEVLLHEMVHCIFGIYKCTDRNCKEDMKRFSLLGPSEHGACWQDAAYAVERAVRDPTFVGLDIELSRNMSLARELNWSGKSVVDVDLRRWAFSERYIEFRHGQWVATGRRPTL